MNIERFHNELAMRLGYERIVNDKRILISVEESDDPVVTLKVQGGEDIRFKASDDAEIIKRASINEMQDEIDSIDFCNPFAALNTLPLGESTIFIFPDGNPKSLYLRRIMRSCDEA